MNICSLSGHSHFHSNAAPPQNQLSSHQPPFSSGTIDMPESDENMSSDPTLSAFTLFRQQWHPRSVPGLTGCLPSCYRVLNFNSPDTRASGHQLFFVSSLACPCLACQWMPRLLGGQSGQLLVDVHSASHIPYTTYQPRHPRAGFPFVICRLDSLFSFLSLSLLWSLFSQPGPILGIS